MRRIERSSGFGGLAVTLWMAVAGCGTGPETGNLQVLMTQNGSAAGSIAPAFAISGAAGDVSLASIESIVLTVVRVDLKPLSEPEGDGGQWIRVSMTEPAPTGGRPGSWTHHYTQGGCGFTPGTSENLSRRTLGPEHPEGAGGYDELLQPKGQRLEGDGDHGRLADPDGVSAGANSPA